MNQELEYQYLQQYQSVYYHGAKYTYLCMFSVDRVDEKFKKPIGLNASSCIRMNWSRRILFAAIGVR